MDWNSIRVAVSKAAPLLGGLIGGPAGAAAGAIVSAALGTREDPDEIFEAIQTDPQAVVKLKEAEMANQVQLASLAIEAEKNRIVNETAQQQIAAADRASARELLKGGDSTARNLAYMYTIMLFVTLGAHILLMVYGIKMDPLALQVLGTLEGVLIAMVLGAKEFFFGSSVSDQKKADDIAQIAKS